MKKSDIKTYSQLQDYIEGIFNDFESGISDKPESVEVVIDLLCYVNSKAMKRFSNSENASGDQGS